MDPSALDRAAYNLAKGFLVQSGMEKGVTPELIEKYLHLDKTARLRTVAGLYERVLDSAQNANMGAGVIGGSIGGVYRLGPVLCDFEPKQVLERYTSGWEGILDEIEARLKPRGSVRRGPRSLWPRFCRTILSGAKFLSQFSSAEDFYSWVDFFDGDERARPALPTLLEKEIDGFGFALACDFVKELGYENFSKPDVHVKDIFWALGLSPWGTSDYEVFKAVARVARNVGVTPYNADKLFWLIGSGNFYEDRDVGKEGKIGGRKKEFIKVAQMELEPSRRANKLRTT